MTHSSLSSAPLLKRAPRRWLLALAVAVAASVAFGGWQRRASAVAKLWNVSSGTWNDDSNWSPTGEPAAGDTVTIASGTCSVNRATANLASFTISGGTVSTTNNRDVTVSGAMTISGGSFTSSSGDVTVGSLVVSSGSYTAGGTGALSAGAATISGGTFTSSGAGAISASTFTVSGGTVTFTGAANLSVTSDFLLSAGSFTGGTGTISVTGNATVQGTTTLTMASTGTLAIGSGKTLTIDGTLNATGGTIRALSGSYAFKVGSSASATPTLNITTLAVQNTDGNGMQINPVAGSTTTFTNFDNIAFSAIGATGVGTQYLHISGSPLYLVSHGLRFGVGDTAIPAAAVNLTDSAGSDGQGAHLVLGGATCATARTDTATSLCLTTWKSDDDSDGNGFVTTTSADGAVVQFIRSSPTDTAGTIEGFPVAAFDWTTFAYYSTYATFHDVSGTIDRVYVRSQTGAAEYSWSTSAGETIVGTPRYVTSGTIHYLFVATNGTTTDSGKIYRLRDNGSSLAVDTAGNWSGRNPFSCGCTITTPLAADATNLYWGGTAGGGQRAFRLAQALAATTPFGLSNVALPATVINVAPALMKLGTPTYMFLGMTGHVLKVDVTGMATVADNTAVGSATVYGRIGTTTSRLFIGDDAGKVRALDPSTFSNTPIWLYNGTDPIKSSSFYDVGNALLMFGTESGKVVVLNSTGGVYSAGYPMTPDSSTGPIRSALLYVEGVIVAGTTTGKLYFIDRSAATLVRKYDFGPTESVSGIGYDANVNRFMVTTSDPATEDGRLHYIDRITDPTPSSL